MTAAVLDTITAAFVDAIQAGIGALSVYSLPLLGVFAIIAFYEHLGPSLASGGAGVGDALAGTLLTLVKTGVFYWILLHFAEIATAAFDTFLGWGIATSGTFSAASF